MQDPSATRAPVVDSVAEQALRIVTALSAEVAVLRERLDIFEQVAVDRALIDDGELDRFQPTPAVAERFKGWSPRHDQAGFRGDEGGRMNDHPIGSMPHHMMITPGSADGTREAYWGELQTFLEAEVRPGFRKFYEAEVAPELRASLGRDPDRYEIADAMQGVVANRSWYAARTEAQRKAFEASRMIVDKQLDVLEARAAALGNGPATLELDAELVFPSYIQPQVHNMEGGYEDAVVRHDLAAGAAYDRALAIHRVAAMGPLVDDVGHSIAARLKEVMPDFRPLRILELGCTVGHTLLPFKAAYPDAEVIGVDVSAPCLRFGAARASALGVEVTFSQRNAEDTGYPDDSFDLIFSRILLHETCAEAVPRVFAECHRLLRPGGVMFHSDAPQFDELHAYTQSLRDWDVRCNFEPFMDGYYALCLEQSFAEAGFARDGMFRLFAPSLVVQRGFDAKETRSFGRYFLAGAVK